jgi:hypothetical protein
MRRDTIDTIEKLKAHATPYGDCLIWSRSIDRHGYGRVHSFGRNTSAHRLAYELVHGAPPAGMVVDHKCRNRACVNPDHLEAVTNRENLIRGLKSRGVLGRGKRS